MAKLHKGDRVMIYKDPFTKTEPEGKATIVKVLASLIETQSLVVVRFAGESETYQRIVNNT